jgi:hypothetical protein
MRFLENLLSQKKKKEKKKENLFSVTVSLAVFQYVKCFSDEFAGDNNKYNDLILYDKMYLHLEDQNSVIQHFLNY